MDMSGPEPWWIAARGEPPRDLVSFRRGFPAMQRGAYLNTASSGIVSRVAADRAQRVIEAICLGEFSKEESTPTLRSARQRFASLIGAEAGQIGVVKNVSDGLNAVATAVPPRGERDNVVVCADLEHPNNIYLWQKMRRHGVDVREVTARAGVIPADELIAAIDQDTRIVTASSVTFTPGFRLDLERVGRAARANGAFFLVDAVQSCGVLSHDLAAENIDALVTSTTKYLLGTAGLGFVAVAPDWINRLEPVYVSRYGVERGSGHESEIEGGDFIFSHNATRFEVGNYNWPAIAAIDSAVEALLSVGPERIERHAVALADALRNGFVALGLPVNAPAEPALRSPMVTLGTLGAGDAYASADGMLNRLADALREAGVRFSIRRGLVRFGLHGFNDETDVAHVLDVARRAIG